jgi:diaminohydroxyphosphoribosylaminopyrimidine deaminase/5-amino-6-(5-phosphoribosylamino)uracil reductase
MHELSAQTAWNVLRECARLARLRNEACSFVWRDDYLQPTVADSTDVAEPVVHWDGTGSWSRSGEFSTEIGAFLDLYLPVCATAPTRPIAVGHLGQSLDGYVATSIGDSQFVNDPHNIVHLHRMRALCDAVVVGGATVRDDNPRLTVRLASGDNPLRVIIDPQRQLSASHQVFSDKAAATLLVTLQDLPCISDELPTQVQVLSVGADANGNPDLQALMHALHLRGCRAVFVEGGGITVSRFVDANLLDRIQIAVAPVFIGKGRAGVRVAAQQSLGDCLRPSHRLFRMGVDLLFDCNLRTSVQEHSHSAHAYRAAGAKIVDGASDDDLIRTAPLPVRML